ncbi:hypothetical protein CGCF415_v003517 [Colletotrichum fructicola]|uniref:Uncharacterized protein n=1 Tax=Colletotrichum fructicola (strain Nara gc5) TaxID=1213859 RepID=A0A7J6JBT0_COLFN|nr:hypothetical protein CGGC5_v006558 [Colletotrichum fructicola Nara gc5]KAF4891367.1 hypothetical protein CGCFRS4_v008277 [Colletotrichum fructicola]KAF4912556.1 hypothetical protein CGCF415_v003517 [Colletotrichum fructicola]KAF4940653.1 hypothetical protein CGCF245_v002400 [Colletotrichum fructicola]
MMPLQEVARRLAVGLVAAILASEQADLAVCQRISYGLRLLCLTVERYPDFPPKYLPLALPPSFYCVICIDLCMLYRDSQRQRQMCNKHFDAPLDVVLE